MTASLLVRAALAALFVCSTLAARAQNFTVTGASAAFNETVRQAAEQQRRELAVYWLGKELPRWARPCPIRLQVGPQLGAGGATSFVFDHGEVFNWQMSIQGSPERLVDSVLPHEITHTIFASHFRQPLPRWADEGACTTVEHASERGKMTRMLAEFLRTGRGIAFPQMFAMKEYPADVMPLYSQGYSLSRFLLEHDGPRQFVGFIGTGLQSSDWTGAVRQAYGYESLSHLQQSWLAWVRVGSPPSGIKHEVMKQPCAGGACQNQAEAMRMVPMRPPGRIFVHEGADGHVGWQYNGSQPAGDASSMASVPLVPIEKLPAVAKQPCASCPPGSMGSVGPVGPEAEAPADQPPPQTEQVPAQPPRPRPPVKNGPTSQPLEPPVANGPTSPPLGEQTAQGGINWSAIRLPKIGDAGYYAFMGAGAALGIPWLFRVVGGNAVRYFGNAMQRRGEERLLSKIRQLETQLGRRLAERQRTPTDEWTAAEVGTVEVHQRNRQVPILTEREGRAWAEAAARMAERHPGTAATLKLVEQVKDQLLSGDRAAADKMFAS